MCHLRWCRDVTKGRGRRVTGPGPRVESCPSFPSVSSPLMASVDSDADRRRLWTATPWKALPGKGNGSFVGAEFCPTPLVGSNVWKPRRLHPRSPRCSPRWPSSTRAWPSCATPTRRCSAPRCWSTPSTTSCGCAARRRPPTCCCWVRSTPARWPPTPAPGRPRSGCGCGTSRTARCVTSPRRGRSAPTAT